MLRPLGWLYGQIINLRNSLYDRGILKSHSLGARTISIGNITTGGTGKTPLVAYVAELLAEGGEKVCILTRGYGRKSSGRVLVSDGEELLVDASEGGDEPVELARKLIGKQIIVADADRVSAARWAKEEFGVTAFILDDGFQHRRAKRDLDIVCIDATDPFAGDRLLPAGRLREPLSNLNRADAIVITRSNLVDDLAELEQRIARFSPNEPVFRSRTELASAESGSSIALADLGVPVFAFCAIGNPENFFELIRRRGYALAGTAKFPDHHYYTQTDVTDIEARARECGASILLTTGKDAVKLESPDLKFDMQCWRADIRTEIDDDERFRRLVTSS